MLIPRKTVVFKHSGDLGDIIYSLPTVKRFGPATFLLDSKNRFPQPRSMTPNNMRMMADLLSTQPYIVEARRFAGERAYNLSAFRKHLRHGRHLALSHWEVTGLPVCDFPPALEGKWFDIEPQREAAIVISRSTRRDGTNIDWKLLAGTNCVFVGLEHEWAACPVRSKFHKVSNFIEMARIISGCDMFVGNQSFGFSLAEAMKKPRFLEVAPMEPNTMPTSPNGHIEISVEAMLRYCSRLPKFV